MVAWRKSKFSSQIFEKFRGSQLKIDLDEEQTISIKSGDTVFHIYKWYPPKKPISVLKRYHLRRLKKGICTYGGCPNKAEKGYTKCKYHREWERKKVRERARLKRKTKPENIRIR